MEKVDGTQPRDPYKAAQKIMEIVKAGNVPFRLILGRDAVEVVEDVLKQRTEELKKWKKFGSQTDF